MKKLINKSAFFAAFAAALTLFAGCEKMPGLEPLSRSIKVNVLISRDSGTKADARPQLLDVIQSESGDMILEEYVSDYPEYSSPVFTKGAAITTDAYNPITGKTFYVEGWLGEDIEDPVKGKDAETADKNDYHFIKKNSVSFDGESWSISGENFWRNGIPTTFWSYVPPTVGTLEIKWPGSSVYGGVPFNTYALQDKPIDDAQKVLSFNYSLPDPGGSDNDAYALQDFLFAYNYETRSVDEDGELTGGPEYININFHHPLAAVKFMMGNISGDDEYGDDEYVNITKVELIDVKTSGSFTATGSPANNCAIACSSTSGSATYSQLASRAEITDGKFTDADSEYVFFMIPQNLSGVKVKLTMVRKKKIITYEPDGKTIRSTSYGEDITFTREVSLSGSWEPGNYYTYKINSTVYFGGEEVTLPPDFVHSDNITVEGDDLKFTISGKVSQSEPWSAWVAPLPTRGVNIIRLELDHYYKCASGKSHRHIWLEAAKLNPDYVEGSTTVPKYISTGRLTKDSDLVSAVTTILGNTSHEKYSEYRNLWPNGYRGILGDFQGTTLGSDDRNMNINGAKEDQKQTSIMYFYLGGEFDYILIHFEYWATAGDGIWTAEIPLFNITEVIE